MTALRRDSNLARRHEDGASPNRLGLGPIELRKTSEVLAERLERQIVEGVYPPGSVLPTERDLVSATGIGRGSVREALRLLQATGLVRTRVGRYGGTVVNDHNDDELQSHIHRFARIRGIALEAIVEARQALEPMVASLAARNRTSEDLAQLDEISAQLEAAAESNVAGFLKENERWHLALAVASHNDLLRAFTASMSGLMLEVSKIENFASADVRQLVVLSHKRILAAIRQKDADAARRRSERDLLAYSAQLVAAVKEGTEEKNPAPASKQR